MDIQIRKVRSNSHLRSFIEFPWEIYKNDPNWVPPLISELKKFLSFKKNPFFLHSKAQYFIAERNGKVLGRIAAIKNNNHLSIYNDDVGFWGFFECIDDESVSRALFDTASAWLRNEKLKVMRGPMSFCINDEIGLLIDGFDTPPMVMMTHNPPYYERLVESYGFKKAKDLYAYQITDAHKIPDRLERGVEIIKKRGKFSVRNINMKEFNEEVERIKVVYNSAWSENWGAVKMTDEEIKELARGLKQIADPDLVFIAEANANPIGVSVTIPNINQALQKINGRLFPFGLIKLLWHARKINTVRVLIMGVVKEYRMRGVDSAFYYQTFKNGLAKGYHSGEMSWILEDNYAMRQPLENMGAKIYKTYRIYDKEI